MNFWFLFGDFKVSHLFASSHHILLFLPIASGFEDPWPLSHTERNAQKLKWSNRGICLPGQAGFDWIVCWFAPVMRVSNPWAAVSHILMFQKQIPDDSGHVSFHFASASVTSGKNHSVSYSQSDTLAANTNNNGKTVEVVLNELR